VWESLRVFRLLVVVPASLFLAACPPTAHVDDASARTSITGAPANATTLPR
jgi:hypothetical protein